MLIGKMPMAVSEKVEKALLIVSLFKVLSMTKLMEFITI